MIKNTNISAICLLIFVVLKTAIGDEIKTIILNKPIIRTDRNNEEKTLVHINNSEMNNKTTNLNRMNTVNSFDIKNCNFTEYFRKKLLENKRNVKSVLTTAPVTMKNIMKSNLVRNSLVNIKQNFRSLIGSSTNELWDRNNESNETKLSYKSGSRFLDLFNVIKFENKYCTTQSSLITPLEGTCYHNSECDSLGGVNIGPCANGFGVCCVFNLDCGTTTRQNVSYFQSPGFPKPSEGQLACAVTVFLHPSTVQVRLDFDIFELKPPTGGTCLDDQFIVSGQNADSKIPALCGINTGQHLYVEVSGTPVLFISVLANSNDARIFRVKITQIQWRDAVPQNCLQYFTDVTGYVESFNYMDKAMVIDTRKPGYLNNLNYAICIRRVEGYCTITYTNEQNGLETFQITNTDQDGISLVPPDQAGAEIFNCPDDFLVVNGIRLCGDRFNDAAVVEDFTVNAPVTDYSAGPIILPFRTNGNITGRGFRLKYQQEEC